MDVVVEPNYRFHYLAQYGTQTDLDFPAALVAKQKHFDPVIVAAKILDLNAFAVPDIIVLVVGASVLVVVLGVVAVLVACVLLLAACVLVLAACVLLPAACVLVVVLGVAAVLAACVLLLAACVLVLVADVARRYISSLREHAFPPLLVAAVVLVVVAEYAEVARVHVVVLLPAFS